MKTRAKTFLAGFLGALLSLLVLHPEATNVGPTAGMMSYVDATTCPSGWAEHTAGRGRAIVALVSGGTLNTAVGTVFTNQENRSHTHTFAHTHSVTAGNYNVSGSSSSLLGRQAIDNFTFSDGTWKDIGVAGAAAFAVNYGPAAVTTNSQSNSTSGSSSAPEAPYLQLLLCAKS